MKYSDLTDYERSRFVRAVCPVCARRVFTGESFIMVKVRNSRQIVYNFLHESCLCVPYKATAPSKFEGCMNPPKEPSSIEQVPTLMPEGIHSDCIDAVFVS